MAISWISGRWNRFWFAPQSTATVELVRIAYGVLMTGWLLSMAPVLGAFYGDGRAVARYTVRPTGVWSVFDLADGLAVTWVAWALGLLAALALTVGWRTRLASVVVFVVLISLMREASPVFNGGDTLVKVLAFYVMLLPAGTALSLDARRRGDPIRPARFPRRAPWALRLIQIQLSIVYLATVLEKLRGTAWLDGTAVSYAMRVGNVNRLPAPAWLTDSPTLMAAATYSTVVLEIAIAVLVWNRRARPWVLGLGVLLHLSIDASLIVGFFGLAMMVLYLAFLPPATAEKLAHGVEAGVARGRRRSASSSTDSAPDAPGSVTRRVPDHAENRTAHSS